MQVISFYNHYYIPNKTNINDSKPAISTQNLIQLKT